MSLESLKRSNSLDKLLGEVQKEFPQVQFYKVGTDLTYEELKQKHTLT